MKLRPTITTFAENLRAEIAGYQSARQLPQGLPGSGAEPAPSETDPLTEWFDNHHEGPGIWKWRHYLPVYHRHLEKFRGREVHIAEIGIYSGGSLLMWRDYFGDQCHIHGIDLAPETRAYEQEGIDVHIGDQADPQFWARFKANVPRVDVVIDDGGHQAHQQIAALRALLPHITAGGVYICEDIHRPDHAFRAFVDGLTRAMNDIGANQAPALPVHQHVESVHHYPLMTVIEKPTRSVTGFESPKHGTVWEPFLDEQIKALG